MPVGARVSYLSFSGSTVTVTRKAIRNLHLRVKPPKGEISVSAPYAATDREILAFLSSHADWIARHRAACSVEKTEKPLSDGTALMLFGSEIRLRLAKEKRRQYAFDDSVLTVPNDKKEGFPSKSAIYRFYLDRMTEVVYPLLLSRSRQIGTLSPSLRFRAMTSRWGSCNVQKRIVTLNIRLVQYPVSLVEYVLVHELVHFMHPNHSPAFYAALSRFLPDHRERKRQLEALALQNAYPDPF